MTTPKKKATRKPPVKKAAPKKKAKTKSPASSEVVAPEKAETPEMGSQEAPVAPSWINLQANDFVPGSDKYAEVISEHNKLFRTTWSTFRVKIGIFYMILRKLKNHYGIN